MTDQVLLMYMQIHCKAVIYTITSHYESTPVASIDETYNPNVAEKQIHPSVKYRTCSAS